LLIEACDKPDVPVVKGNMKGGDGTGLFPTRLGEEND